MAVGLRKLNYVHADKLMRDRYGLMLDNCPTPSLWGLSVLGTSARVYCGNKGIIRYNSSGYPSPRAFVVRPFPIVSTRRVGVILAVTGGI